MSTDEKLSLADVVDLAKSAIVAIIPEAQRPTIDEFSFDESTGTWTVTIGFWLDPPNTLGAKFFATALNREQRVLKISGTKPGAVLSMKIKGLIGS